jgi:Transposase DDE domain
MLHGERTRRSHLDPDAVVARRQARGVEQLRGAAAVWVLVDGSDLRTPHARRMEGLQRVKRLSGEGTVPGYRTLTALGVGRRGRGLLYHRLFSSHAPGFKSESDETQQALASIGTALAPLGAEVTYVLDAGFDDIAVAGAIWQQGNHAVWRVRERDRLVRPAPGEPLVHLHEAAGQLRPLAQVATELVVRRRGQPRPKLQRAPATIAATALVVAWREDVRTRPDGAAHEQRLWLVEVRLADVEQEPWWLLTDRPVETAAQAVEVVTMYRQRWAVEDAFKVGKTCLGWEAVQLLADEAVQLLVALGWVAAGFLYELGVTLAWAEVRFLARLGGAPARPDYRPGKIILTRGLRRLLDLFATEAIIQDEVRRYGSIPPRLAALIGRSPTG